jgi:hypothetical protein
MEIIPTRMKPAVFVFKLRKSVKRPMEKKPTTGQKMISKKLKTFRLVMIQFLITKAHI